MKPGLIPSGTLCEAITPRAEAKEHFMTNDITNTRLNKLTACEGNVRKTQVKGSIDDLATSIKADALQQTSSLSRTARNSPSSQEPGAWQRFNSLPNPATSRGTYEVPCRLTLVPQVPLWPYGTLPSPFSAHPLCSSVRRSQRLGSLCD
jgi:hypothetical protein